MPKYIFSISIAILLFVGTITYLLDTVRSDRAHIALLFGVIILVVTLYSPIQDKLLQKIACWVVFTIFLIPAVLSGYWATVEIASSNPHSLTLILFLMSTSQMVISSIALIQAHGSYRT